jgi:ubiquinone/menaquinone biosynthesis C-methylase UbiE
MRRRMTDYLEHPFDDWAAIAADYDELPLWSAPFGQLLLEHVPLRRGMRVLDLACGTGFPLLELAPRLGPTAFAVGVDPWRAGVLRASSKRRAHRIANAVAVIADAAKLPLRSDSIDLIVSNLGVNNLADADAALAECARVAKSGGVLALSTNLRGHWSELYAVFDQTLRELGRDDLLPKLRTHVDHRSTVDSVRALAGRHGFSTRRVIEGRFAMRFLDGSAFLRHYFVRLAFLPAWRELLPQAAERAVFGRLEANLNALAQRDGALALGVPMAYVECERA